MGDCQRDRRIPPLTRVIVLTTYRIGVEYLGNKGENPHGEFPSLAGVLNSSKLSCVVAVRLSGVGPTVSSPICTTAERCGGRSEVSESHHNFEFHPRTGPLGEPQEARGTILIFGFCEIGCRKGRAMHYAHFSTILAVAKSPCPESVSVSHPRYVLFVTRQATSGSNKRARHEEDKITKRKRQRGRKTEEG